MQTKIKLDPVTRIEGHLEIEVTVDEVGGVRQVVEARSAGTLFRGFEMLMIDRDPRDAALYTQRICGVCPVSHGLAAALNLENAFGVTAPDNGRILRNLVLAANFLQSHILHFYHLSLVDYVNTSNLLPRSPWIPRYVTPDLITGETAAALVEHYLEALVARRKAHQMGAIFAGRLPGPSTFVAGGNTEVPTDENIAAFRALLTEIRGFVENTYVPDVLAVAKAFPDYFRLGRGCGNLLAYGVFDLDADGQNKFIRRGRITDGVFQPVEPREIGEYVRYSWYAPADGGLHPSVGQTAPEAGKNGAYSWIKAPRYLNKAHEAGPLARMKISNRYDGGISVMDRLHARALEAKMLAEAMDGWLDQLVPGAPVYCRSTVPESAAGIGLTEAPRGALGHWMDVKNHVVSRYQVITPTVWNASPRDDFDQPGPIEQALVGTPIADENQPIELLRVVHSFDPCLACAVHMVRPGGKYRQPPLMIPPAVS